MIIAVLSDIHGNLAALESVVRDMPPADEVWCLGDIVGYGPRPNECIEMLQTLKPTVVVAGNHDWAAVDKLDSREFNPEAAEAVRWTARQLSPENKLLLKALPVRATRGEWTIVHGSPRFPVSEYIFDCSDALPSFAHFDTRYCLVGHTHVPGMFISVEDQTGKPKCVAHKVESREAIAIPHRQAIINPGSVGQPRDGDYRASYALIEADTRKLELRRVPYNVEQTQDEMRQVGLPARLWLRLSYGL